MRAVDALGEIAFWLERDLASPFKTKAFRAAAEVIRPWSEDELAARLADGRLKDTKGIGGTTFEVISEAVTGGIPAYLIDVRARLDVPLTTEGKALRSLLKGDLHSHSEWSDGTTTIAAMAETARWLGLEYLVLSDHSPHLRVANGLTAERLRDQLKVIDGLNDAATDDFRILTGIEVDILDDGALDQVPELLDRLDIVVASVHSKLKMDRTEMTARMVAAVSNPHTNVLGHITGQLVEGSRGTRPGSSFEAEAVFAACAAHDVAVEINSRPERRDPPDDLIAMALDAGCLFSIDSDAHAPGQLAFIDYGAARAEALGVPADRIVTTWSRNKLLDWAG
ncbi:MAG: PHP domain-containing protein [Rhodoglobus sp.]